ncbi:MAG: WYL domain-containing protein [bacterium]
MIARSSRPPAWPTLERALTERRPVRAVYHSQERVLCPHALGWKNGRPKVLAYQVAGTSQGGLPADPRQRWRSMFVDEIEDAMITDGPWKTADNYSHDSNCIDELEIEVG